MTAIKEAKIILDKDKTFIKGKKYVQPIGKKLIKNLKNP